MSPKQKIFLVVAVAIFSIYLIYSDGSEAYSKYELATVDCMELNTSSTQDDFQKCLEDGANYGLSLKQANLAVLLLKKGDKAGAKFWATKSAERDTPEAMDLMGTIYQQENNIQKSVEWYTKSVDKGYEISRTNLALLYLKGLSPDHSQEDGLTLLKQAASNGEQNAIRLLEKIQENVEL